METPLRKTATSQCGKLDLREQPERRTGDAVEEADAVGAVVPARCVRIVRKVSGRRPALNRHGGTALQARVAGERTNRVIE
jgi:hypothetical protein